MSEQDDVEEGTREKERECVRVREMGEREVM